VIPAMNTYKKRSFRTTIRKSCVGIVFLLPAVVLLTYTIYFPMVWNVILSFQQWDGYLKKKWVGLGNFNAALHDPEILHSLWNSVLLAFIATVLAVTLGMLFAVLLYRMQKIEGALYRLILFLPVMLPVAIVGLLFQFMYNPEAGPIDNFLRMIGLGRYALAWLEDSRTALFSIALVGAWKMMGLTMLLCFAGLQLIPQALFEASIIDGATFREQVFTIMLPLVKPIMQISAVYTLVVSFKGYDLVYVMSRGGPGTLTYIVPLQMINLAFNFNEFGLSSAVGFILSFVVLMMILITKKVLGGEPYEFQ